MNIIRGTFRLSIGVALLVVGYHAVTGYMEARKSEQEATRLWFTLRCGERFLGQDMRAYTNEYGLIDIGKAGCELDGRRFLATFDEIRKAVASPDASEYGRNVGELFRVTLDIALAHAFAW
jgi:hypothetical protein